MAASARTATVAVRLKVCMVTPLDAGGVAQVCSRPA
jgi:hypothetical protein